MADAKISRDSVLSAIYDRGNEGRLVWTTSTTLAAMGIEQDPHLQNDDRRNMENVLAGLCDEGLLVRRGIPHAHHGIEEVTYERVGLSSNWAYIRQHRKK